LLQVKKWSGKRKILQGQRKVREISFESGKIDDILKKSRGAELIPLKAGRNNWVHWHLDDIFRQ